MAIPAANYETLYIQNRNIPNGAFFNAYNVTTNGMVQQILVPKNPVESLSFIWIAVCSIFVLLMQAGFALLEAGSVHAKNTKTLLFKNFFDLLVGTLAWSTIGYAIAFGKTAGGFIGTTGWFLMDVVTENDPNTFATYFFQLTFAATASTIDSGSVSERMGLTAYLICSTVICLVTYPLVAHWIWNEGGWLKVMGFLDFAGGTAVHVVGGICGLVSAVMLGPRIGRFDSETRQPNEISGHSVVLQSLGTWILFVGWFAFNAGATIAMPFPTLTHNEMGEISEECTEACYSNTRFTGIVLVNTLLSGVCSSTVASLFYKVAFGMFDVEIMLNSLLAGLVSVTPGCAFFSLAGAVTTGCLSGLMYPIASRFLLHRCFVDDPLDAAVVHGFSGVWGTIAVGLFHKIDGVFYGGSGQLLGVQILGMITVIVWTAFIQYFTLLFIIRFVGPIRVPREIEEIGCDCELEGGAAYSLANDAQIAKATSNSNSLVVQLVQPNNPAHSYFTDFLKEKKCMEVMELYHAIQAFQSRPTCSVQAIHVIYNQYIASSSESQVNLPGWARREVESRRNIPSRTIFDDVLKECHLLLQELCDNHFIHSNYFTQYLAKSSEKLHSSRVIFPRLGQMWCINSDQRYNRSKGLTPDQIVLRSRVEELLTSTVLLLGTGESGKSTVMKQISLQFNNSVDGDVVVSAVNGLRRNAVECMQVLLRQSEKYGFVPSTPEHKTRKLAILDIDTTHESCTFNDVLAKSISTLWKEAEFVRKTYERREEFWLLEACDYYMENVVRFADTPSEAFSPNTKDFLMSRIKTSGAHETKFTSSRNLITPKGNSCQKSFKFIDVGGQRSERRKWLQFFDQVDTILFVINLNSYHTPLFEDPSTTGLNETIDLVQEIFNGKRFLDQNILVLLNKVDLFGQSFDAEKLRVVFPDLPEQCDVASATKFVSDKFCEMLKTRGYSNITVRAITASNPNDIDDIIPVLEQATHPINDIEAANIIDSKEFKLGVAGEEGFIDISTRRGSTDRIRRRIPGISHSFLGELLVSPNEVHGKGAAKVVDGQRDAK